MKLESEPTWLNYLKTIKCELNECEQFKLTEFDDFIQANSVAHSFFSHSIPVIYMLDYRNGTYLNMSENFAGYKSECFLKGGISHTLEIIEKDHLKLFNHEIFPDRLRILKETSPSEHSQLVFTYNSSCKNQKGGYEHYLQRNCFLSDENGLPILSMGMLLNITHYNHSNLIMQTVDKINIEGVPGHETIFKKAYYLREEDKLFSKREKEVLMWMAEGLSSKMIADKLFISEHTVINHRRSMQEKTNTPNAIALVSFAIKSGVLNTYVV